MKGVQYYNSGNLASAYQEFIDAGGKYALAYPNRTAYDKCQEYHDFSLLNSNSKEVELNGFMTKYPNSTYTNQVSNWIAIAKAKEFSMYTTEGTYKMVLSYAKDDVTRNQVKSYYVAKQNEYSQYKKSVRRANRRANGGWVNVGWEIIDFGFNMAFKDRDLNILTYNMGLGLRIGNFTDRIQFEIGVKPGLVVYNINSGKYYDADGNFSSSTCKFHMPVYAKLKLNLFKAGQRSWKHINGQAYYNAVREKYIENEFSFTAGLGVAWRHWDWTILYYKQDLGTKYTYSDNKFLGMSLSYFF